MNQNEDIKRNRTRPTVGSGTMTSEEAGAVATSFEIDLGLDLSFSDICLTPGRDIHLEIDSFIEMGESQDSGVFSAGSKDNLETRRNDNKASSASHKLTVASGTKSGSPSSGMRTKSKPTPIKGKVPEIFDLSSMSSLDGEERARSATPVSTRKQRKEKDLSDKRSPTVGRSLDTLRRQKGGRIALPPVSKNGESDDEDWIDKRSHPIHWYLDLVNAALVDTETYTEIELQNLKTAWNAFASDSRCPFVICDKNKTFSTRPRFARHLVELHLKKRPSFGCIDSDFRGCPKLADGKRFHSPRRGDLVRHLASQHQYGAPKACEYVLTVFKYPDRASRPHGGPNPQSIFFGWESNDDPSQLKLPSKKSHKRRSEKVSTSSTTSTPKKAREVSSTLPAESLPRTEPSPPCESPPPSEETPLTPAPESVTPILEPKQPSFLLPLPEEWTFTTLPREAVLQHFWSRWSCLTRDALDVVDSTLLETRKEAKQEVLREQQVEQQEALGKLQSLVESKDKELKEKSSELDELRRKTKHLKQELSYAKIKNSTLEARYESMDKKFTLAAKMSLEVWDGTPTSLLAGLSTPSSDEEGSDRVPVSDTSDE